MGGSKLVLLQLAKALPAADVLTLWNDNPDLLGPTAVYETVLRRAPSAGRKAVALPLMPAVWRYTRARTAAYDWVVVSSHAFAHHVRTRDGVKKLVYAHTPARYLWAPELDRRGDNRPARLLAPPLKALDRARAAEADAIAVNSRYIQTRVEQAWSRESTVIYPPVRVEMIQSAGDWGHRLSDADVTVLEALPPVFLLGASRFVAYKRLELVIKAGELTDTPVVLAGGGPETRRLTAKAAEAAVPVHIIGDPSDALLFSLYQRALVYVFPAVEDFGIMPVEAAASGTPVIVNHIGGAAESVAVGITGAVVNFDSDEEIATGVETARNCSSAACREGAGRFSEERFRREVRAWAGNHLGFVP